jgi:hypothetical protein
VRRPAQRCQQIGDVAAVPVNRLFNGYDDSLRNALIQGEINGGKSAADAEQAVDTFLGPLRLDPVQSGMPLPDAIALARFMVETTEGYARYRIGPDTVGGPVEVASCVMLVHHAYVDGVGASWLMQRFYQPQPGIKAGDPPPTTRPLCPRG